MRSIVKRLAAKRDLTQHFVWFAKRPVPNLRVAFCRRPRSPFKTSPRCREGDSLRGMKEVRRRAHVSRGRLRELSDFPPPITNAFLSEFRNGNPNQCRSILGYAARLHLRVHLIHVAQANGFSSCD